MAKPSLIEQLDAAVEALRTGAKARPARLSPGVAALARLAADLRTLPRPEFKARLRADLQRRATMGSKPQAAMHSVTTVATPYLAVRDAAAAIEFYKRAFGAVELMRLTQPDGKIGHAQIRIGEAGIMLADEFPEYEFLSPKALGGSPMRINLVVPDVDAFVQRAVAAGARVTQAIKDEFYGERCGQIEDPFGFRWMVSTPKEELSGEEVQRRFDALMKGSEAAARQEGAVRTTRFIREGFRTVTPYLAVPGADGLLDFVKRAFGAEELLRAPMGGGSLHAEVRIGDSMVMIGGAGPDWQGPATPAAIHLYVPDADAAHARAVAAGGTQVAPPEDKPYGERSSHLRDAWGNQWFIGAPLKGPSPPPGLQVFTPYLLPRDADAQMQFIRAALGGEEVACYRDPAGRVMHAQMRIGTSMIELGQASGPYQPMPAMFYLYVEDADALYQRALAAGAASLSEPAEQPYGDRVAAVTDPLGHKWYLATHVKDV